MDNKIYSKKPEGSQQASAWQILFKRLSIISGLFSLTICIFLFAAFRQGKLTNFLDSEELAMLKTKSSESPENKELKEKIRTFDEQLRKDYFKRIRLTQYGAYLLLGGMALFLISLKTMKELKKDINMPPPGPRESQYKKASGSRWAVIVFAISLGTVSWYTPKLFPNILTSSKKQKILALLPTEKEINANWPSFRGPGGLGIYPLPVVPTSWDGKTGKGILWKTALPQPKRGAKQNTPEQFLPGESSPVIWGDKLFFTGATAYKRELYCLDTKNGKLLWRSRGGNIPRQTQKPPKVKEANYFATPTPATDGRRIYTMFANGDVVAFDFEGKRVWAVNLGLPDNPYCHSTSLIIYKKLLIVQFDQANEEDGKSNIIALNFKTGRTVWKTKRPVGASWTTPIIINANKQEQIITCAVPWVISYAPATGKEIWRLDCMDGEITPSPVFADGIVYTVHTMAYLNAINPDGSGDVTKTNLLWQSEDGLPDVCSPVTNGKFIFLLTSEGLLTCVSTKKGKLVWEKDYALHFQSSPSIAGNKLYIISAKGLTIITEISGEYKEVARNDLGEKVHTIPAFHDGRIYIRGFKHLFCIGNTSK